MSTQRAHIHVMLLMGNVVYLVICTTYGIHMVHVSSLHRHDVVRYYTYNVLNVVIHRAQAMVHQSAIQ